MSAAPRARSSVPLAQRSAVPTIPGVSAAMAVAIAVGCTFIGYLIDAARGVELTRAFSTLYFLGCVSASLVVRHRGLFTTVVQPPLILFAAVPLAYYNLKDSGTSMRDIALNVAYPLVDRFPLMAATTVIVLLVGLLRVVLAHQRHTVRAPEKIRPRQRPQRAARPAPAKQTDRTPTRRQAPATAEPRARRQAPAPAAEEPRYRRQPAPDPRPTRRARHEAPDTDDRPYRRTIESRDRATHRASDSDSVPRFVDDYYSPAPPVSRRSAERRHRAEYPSHPMPQVRYREREEPPYSR